MKRNRSRLLLQSVLCIVFFGALAAGILVVYRDGLAQKAADPLLPIYTPKTLTAALLPALPLLLLNLIVFFYGLFQKSREEGADNAATLESFPQEGADCDVQDLSCRRVRALRVALLALAVFFLLAGVYNGGAGAVFGKAASICSECIGLG